MTARFGAYLTTYALSDGESHEKESTMKQIICPLDGKPCEADCPDRYVDQPEGGCLLTTAQEMGAQIIYLSDGCAGILFLPAN